jgi:hypothetical protein
MMKTFPLLVLLLASAGSAAAQDAPVDWKTLATEFTEDAAAAQAKYQGRTITVTGPVSAIAAGDMTTESDPAVAVTLSTPDGPGPDVKCLFENEDLEPNRQLYVPGDNSEVLLRTTDGTGNVTGSQPFIQSGQDITVTGSFFGYVAGEIVVRHARLVPAAAP